MADLYNMWSQARDRGEQRGADYVIRQNIQPALSGNADALSTIFSKSPDTGMKVQGFVADQRKAQADEFGKLSLAYTQSKNPQIYSQWRQRGVSLGLLPAETPEALTDPADIPGSLQAAQAFAQVYGGAKAQEPYTLSPGSKRFDQNNQMVAEVPFAPEKQDFVLSPDGTQWLPKPMGRQPQQGGFGTAETDNYVRSILGKAGPIDPSTPPEVLADKLLPHLIQQESGGNPNAVSPKGARGLTQVMPTTGQNPGFGVMPVRNGSPQENVRFGRDYLTAMLKRYPGRPDLALAAYNAGPGVADRFAQPQASNGSAIPIPGAQPKPQPGQQAPSGYRFNTLGNLEFIPGGPADPSSKAGEKPSATQIKLANTAKAKLIDLKAMEDQLTKVEAAFSPLKGSYSAGPGGGYLPTVEGKRFDAAVSLLKGMARKLTRTPGEGAMSDYESKLAELANPSRSEYEDVTADQIQQLRALVKTTREGYEALLQDAGGNTDNLPGNRRETRGSAPAGNANGWSIEVVP